MKIDITPLLSEINSRAEYYLNEKVKIDIGEEVATHGPVSLSIEVVNTGMGLVAKGNLSLNVVLKCSVCLKEFIEELSFGFKERFVDEAKVFFPDEKDYEVQEDGIFFTYGSDLTIDFAEMIRQLVILNLPIAPKCDINCQVQTTQQKKEIDPRLAVLAKLKSKSEE